MSDGRATADQELSTSDTAVPSRGDKTHVPEPQAATLIQDGSTRNEVAVLAATVIDSEKNVAEADDPAAQTLIASEAGAKNDDGGDYRFGATVVANGAPDEAGGFQLGETVIGAEDPSIRATRDADIQNSFDSGPVDESGIQPGESLIGRFHIIRTLGEGSFGSVYLAHDPQLDRRVAIKVTKVGVLTTRSDVDRFQREAKAAAQLRHPNIVPVYDTGRIGRSSFLAYEYIEGKTLGSHLKEHKKLPSREAAQVMHAIAAALGYAHELGIIHRDMKPDNVLLDKQGQPHIADFGLARRESGEMDKTREGGLMGTPLYMSPEQASGRSHEADARADVWSLGVMLREMLTGVLPFTGKLTEILIAIQTAEPPSIRTIDKSLPRDLETICQKCLSKDPALRYANGTELAAELERYLRGEPILARPLSMPARAWRWMRRNPNEAGWIVASVAILLVASAVSISFGLATRREQNRRALDALDSMTTMVASAVPQKVLDLRRDREIIADQLRQKLASDSLTPLARNRLLLASATLFPESAKNDVPFDDLVDALVTLPVPEARMQVELLESYRSEVVPRFRQIAQDRQRPIPRRTALYALATLDAGADDWSALSADVAAGLLDLNDPSSALELVAPIRDRVAAELEKLFADARSGEPAARVLANMFEDGPHRLYALARRATPEQLRSLIAAMRSNESNSSLFSHLALNELSGLEPGMPSPDANLRAQRNAYLVLYGVAPDDINWSLLAGGGDNSLRTEIIYALPLAVPEWKPAVDRLETETNPLIRQALLLILTGFAESVLQPVDVAPLREAVARLFETDPSPAVHAAAWQFLQKNGDDYPAADLTLEQRGNRGWYRSPLGHEFAVIDGPVDFMMGSRPDEVGPGFEEAERLHRRRIPRSFAIGMREVTVAEFQTFSDKHPGDHSADAETSPEADCPVNSVTWFDAARFCRWLSEQEGIPEDQMCFPPIDQIGDNMVLPGDVLERTGYRLPTAAEWEFACRGNSTTLRFVGQKDQTVFGSWAKENSRNQMHPVGGLAPNSFGLFDTLGNAWEWCQECFFDSYPLAQGDQPVIDGTDPREAEGYLRELRGSSYATDLLFVRTAYREGLEPGIPGQQNGFRLARTIHAPQPSPDNRP